MLFGVQHFTNQLTASIAEDDTSFGPSLATVVDEATEEIDTDSTSFGFGKLAFDDHEPEIIRAEASGQVSENQAAVPGFRAQFSAATLPEVLKFLIDRTGYI